MTKIVICRELWVKFKDKNEHTQEIRIGDVQGAQYLQVEVDGGILQVCYVFWDTEKQVGKILKVINWIVNDVKEWYCDKITN